MKNTLKPSEKFDEVYNKGKGRPVSKIFHWIRRKLKK